MNSKRHKLLEILSKRAIDIQLRNINESAVGVSYEKICERLNCNRDELYKLSNVLFDEKEVGTHDAYEIKGMYATQKGITSYTDKKYLRLRNLRIKNNVKDIVSIVIPVLSLLIALASIWFKVDTINTKNEKEIKEMKRELKLNDKKLEDLKTKRK
jgi:hypothetical protein